VKAHSISHRITVPIPPRTLANPQVHENDTKTFFSFFA
jgi:hypothetical protein